MFDRITYRKNNIIANEEYDKNLLDKIDKVIESIQIYLSVASKIKIQCILLKIGIMYIFKFTLNV